MRLSTSPNRFFPVRPRRRNLFLQSICEALVGEDCLNSVAKSATETSETLRLQTSKDGSLNTATSSCTLSAVCNGVVSVTAPVYNTRGCCFILPLFV